MVPSARSIANETRVGGNPDATHRPSACVGSADKVLVVLVDGAVAVDPVVLVVTRAHSTNSGGWGSSTQSTPETPSKSRKSPEPIVHADSAQSTAWARATAAIQATRPTCLRNMMKSARN